MPNLDSNTRTSGSWDPDEPIFLMAQKFTACEYPYGGFQKNEGTPRWIVSNGKSICKWMIWGNPYFRKPPYHHISGFWLLLVPLEKSLCTSCSRCWTHCSCSWRGSSGAPCGGFQKNGGTQKSCKIDGHQCENPMVCGTHIFRNPPKVEGSNHQTWRSTMRTGSGFQNVAIQS